MRKRFILIAIAILCLTTSVFGEEGNITIYLDGDVLNVSSAPFIENGTTLVPMRSIFEALGMKVDWDESTRTVSGIRDGITVKLTIGNNIAYINGLEKELPIAAKIVNGNTMVPLRFISESAGCEVNWDGANKEITIQTSKYKKGFIDEGAIFMESTDEMANIEELYAVDAIGEYTGYKMLKGYPGEEKFQVYFKGDFNSQMTTYEELEGKDLNEIITWEYKNIVYKNTRRDLYRFFSDTSEFSSSLGISNEILSYDWFIETFGNTYTDWMQRIAYSNDASTLVGKYLEKESGFKFENRYEILDSIDDLSEAFENINNITTDWIGEKELLDKKEISCTEFNPGEITFSTMGFTSKKLHTIILPSNWDGKEITVDKIRIKKIESQRYYFVDDLIKLRIIEER